MAGEKSRISSAQWTIVGIILASTIGMIYYRFLRDSQIHQTAALYVGLPALLAILVTLTPKAKSLYGMAIKGVTVALLGSMIFLGEGLVCILFAAPIFYFVAIAITAIIDITRKSIDKRDRTIRGILLLPVLALALEGVTPGLSFNRTETVSYHRAFEATPNEIEKALSQELNFNVEELPLFLRLGFPFPTQTLGAGNQIGDSRSVLYEIDSNTLMGLEFEIAESKPGYLRMTPTKNATVFANWLSIGDSEIIWEATPDGDTSVTWTIHYQRLLDPAWYFKPLQRYAMTLVAGYLITAQISAN